MTTLMHSPETRAIVSSVRVQLEINTLIKKLEESLINQMQLVKYVKLHLAWITNICKRALLLFLVCVIRGRTVKRQARL